MKIDNAHYYIDRCELWGFFHEINSGISHVRYHFFPAGTTFTQLQVWWLRPLFIYSEYTYDCKLKKFREMLLTTLSHNQHDVIDVIWRLPVWNVKIRRYLASCTLQFWIITLLPFFIEMLQYDWLRSGHMIIKEMFHIPMKLKSELARASMTRSDVNNQWRSNFQQQII